MAEKKHFIRPNFWDKSKSVQLEEKILLSCELNGGLGRGLGGPYCPLKLGSTVTKPGIFTGGIEKNLKYLNNSQTFLINSQFYICVFKKSENHE